MYALNAYARTHDNGMHAVTGKPVCLLCFVVSDALIHSSAGMGPFITTSTAWRSMCWGLLVKGLQDFAWAALCLVATLAQRKSDHIHMKGMLYV